ncbi:helix-turn-helix domain-containing protein [Virgisporangium ochraceum]|uniref:helix-turn-helix domain-containing protein n=1 Tax=Virgisporangium ochraceum TaxID=65505 RepID=UPI0019424E45|nr:cupin domain-containing protein [Virgisporangium ochraceum]
MASSAVPPIGARLRAERRRRDISVRGLAREIGVSASLISQIETEKSSPSVSTLYAITTALGISIEDLFGDQPAAADDGLDEPSDPGPGEDAVQANGSDHRGPARVPALAAVGDPAIDAVGGPVVTSLGAGGGVLLSALAAAGAGGSVDVGASGPDKRLGPVVPPELREVLTLDSGVTWELLGRIPHKHVDFLLITYEPGGTSSSSGLLMRHSGAEFGFVVSGELVLTLGFDTHRLRAGDAVSFDSSTPHSYRNETTEPAVGVWFVLERST